MTSARSPIHAIAFALLALPAAAQDKITFLTNWFAQGEHGGFYQALADGTYAAYGLDVTVEQGGPQANGLTRLIAGQVDFYMAGVNTALNTLQQGVPTLTVAAIFQKDPQVMIAHPDQGFDSFADLARADRILISSEGQTTLWAWMKANFDGFSDSQVVPYAFSTAPFLADDRTVQQGYLTSEPYAIESAAGFTPKVFLFADEGYDPYSTTIMGMRPFIEANPDLTQRFVEASIIGWYNYLYGDNGAADELIKAANPEMNDARLAYSRDKMVEYGILVSGDAVEQGIGCMTDARWQDYYGKAVGIGLFPAGLDIGNAYTSEFVCKGIGTDLVK